MLAARLKNWNHHPDNPELAAVIETTRGGFLVSIRFIKDGWVEDIVGERRLAAAIGRTVDIAFERAMDIAEEELIVEEEEPPTPPRRRRR